MTSITKQPNDDLEALIDLLADGDDETNALQGHGLHYLSMPHEPNAGEEQRERKDSELAGLNSWTLDAMPTFDPSAEAAAQNARVDGPRQSTPVMQPKGASSNLVQATAAMSMAATPFSPESAEIDLPNFPPMAPFLPPVRSLAHISNPTASRNQRATGQGFPPNFRIPSAAIHAISPDLLPVSPFLLSPSPLGGVSGGNGNNRDSSRSPFFIQQGSAATSPSESPQLRMRSLSQASIEANIDPQTQFLASQSTVRNVTRSSLSMSTASRSITMDQLTGDLEQARAELIAVRQECEQLRKLVQSQLSPDPEATAFAQLSQARDQGVSISEPLSNTVEPPSTPKASASSTRGMESKTTARDSVDAMTEKQAKEKLKAILAYLNLPASSLQSLSSTSNPSNTPPSFANPTTITPLASTPLARSRPGSRGASRNPSLAHIPPPSASSLPLSSSSSLLSPPKTFADVRRALSFIERTDELVWKRALLASYGISHSRSETTTGALGSDENRHVAPLDFLLLRNGQTVRRRTSSLGNKTNATDDAHVKEKDGQAESEMNVFDEANLRAIEDRLVVWERAVRSRPRR